MYIENFQPVYQIHIEKIGGERKDDIRVMRPLRASNFAS